MPNNNGNNGNHLNASNYNARAAARKQKRTEKLKAKQLKNNKVYRPANSGKFEHLRKVVAEFNKNSAAYIRYKNRKLAEEMARQNNEQKPEKAPEQVNQTNPETEIKNENNVIIEEPVIKEEPQKPIEEVVNVNGVETMGLEDIKVDDSELDDPEIDEALEKLEQTIKKEEELKARGIDPDTVEEPDDPKFAQEVRELMQENEEKLEGAALEEALQSLSDEVDAETKNSDADDSEIEDSDVNEDINRIEREIKEEKDAAKLEENNTEAPVQTNETEEIDDIIVEDVKEKVEVPVQTSEIKLLGEEKVELPVENSQPKPESTVLQSNNVNNPLSTSHLSEEALARSRFSDALKRNDPRHRTVRTPFNEQRELSRRDVIIDAVTEDETDFEIDYGISETVSALNETESVNTHQISMPEYSNLLEARSEDKEITARATSITTNILKAAGAKLPEESTLVTDTYNKLFATIKDAGTEATMHDLAVKTFEDSYDMLRGADLKPKEHFVAAQNIANVMLNAYSPIAFMNGELTQYAESYVAMNESLLRQQLEKNGFSNEELDLLASNVRDAVTGEPEPEPEPKVNGQSYFLKFSRQLENKGLQEQVKKQLAVILNESGIKDGVDAGEIAKGILETNLGTIDSSYNPELVPLNPQTSTLAKMFYSEAYKSIYDVTLEENDKIMTAQKITDVILKNYSPAAFDKEKFGKYANNFIVGNKDNLKECLTDAEVPEEEIEAAMQRDMKSELRWAYFKNAMRNLDQQDTENEAEIEAIPEIKEQVPVINEQELELSAPIMNKQIENKETVEIKPEEITEIKVEKQNEPTLADDFELTNNNSNEPEPETIEIVEDEPKNNEQKIESFEPIVDEQIENKENVEIEPEAIEIVEDEPEKLISEKIEEKQVNPEPAKLDAHTLFQQIQNNVLNPRKIEKKEVAEPKPKEKPKPVYSVPPIPGMKNSNFKRENTNDAPVLSKEEREAKELADAKAKLKILTNNRTGTTQDRADRAKLINYYQGIVNKYKSPDELFKESLELAEKARREAKEREEREKQLKELEKSVKNDIAEDKDNNNTLEIENAGEEISSLRIDDFYDKLRLRMGNDSVATRVRSEMTEILKEAGITDREKASDIVASSYFEIKDTINSLYDPDVIAETKMSTDAPLFFYNAFISLKNSDLSTKDRIITAQKFADVMLKNYSPVAFVEKELDRFADNYVLNDIELLGVQLYSLGFTNSEVNKLTNEIFGIPEKEQPEQEALNENVKPQPLHIPNFKQWLNGQISNANLNKRVRSELTGIIKSAGVTDQELLSRSVELSLAFLPKTISSSPFLDVENPEMPDIALQFFADSYNSIAWAELNTKDRVITAQKIANLMLKHYSPVALKELQLDQYANNYVVNNRELLGLHLEAKGIDRDKIGPLIDEVQTALAGDLINGEISDDEMYAGLDAMFTEAGDDSHKSVVFTNKLDSFARMYKLKVGEKQFSGYVSKAWALMKSGEARNVESGKKMLGDFFKSTLQSVLDIEKNASYKEHRIPEFNEIIISTNELFRAAMYAFTDLYHNPKSELLYAPTAFGGFTAKELAELTAGDSLWKMDQKSDAAWEIQSEEAKNLADQWLKEDKPYEKMINEMNGLIESNKNGTLSQQEMYSKLTAAEWLLVNNEKMMIEDPEDPLNPIPNWGNRYWKAITAAREAIGISKHTSMRELIQGNYAEIAKAVVSTKYNEQQIGEHILAPDVRELYDSYSIQMVEFATQSEANYISSPPKHNVDEKGEKEHEHEIRWREPVKSEDEREKMRNEPKVFTNMVIEKTNELQIDSVK